MKVSVGVSAHHVHLTKESFKVLFGLEEMEKRNDLNQIGEFASNHLLTIKNNDRVIENVRVLGPFRSYNQVELSNTECIKLKLNTTPRRSGEIDNTPGVTLVGPNGELTLDKGVIIAERHLHITKEMAKKYNIIDKQKLKVKINGQKEGIIYVNAKVSDNAYFEIHLDTDDANAFLIKNGDEVELMEI